MMGRWQRFGHKSVCEHSSDLRGNTNAFLPANETLCNKLQISGSFSLINSRTWAGADRAGRSDWKRVDCFNVTLPKKWVVPNTFVSRIHSQTKQEFRAVVRNAGFVCLSSNSAANDGSVVAVKKCLFEVPQLYVRRSSLLLLFKSVFFWHADWQIINPIWKFGEIQFFWGNNWLKTLSKIEIDSKLQKWCLYLWFWESISSKKQKKNTDSSCSNHHSLLQCAAKFSKLFAAIPLQGPSAL